MCSRPLTLFLIPRFCLGMWPPQVERTPTMPFFRIIESSCERAAGGRSAIAGGAPEPRPFLTAGDHRSCAAWCWRIKPRDALAVARQS